MNKSAENILIRPFEMADKNAVREISYQTAFLERAKEFCDDPNLLMDSLTIYFTDFEPGSCFVACLGGKVIGYLLGTKNVREMNRICFLRIWPRLIKKFLKTGGIFNKKYAALFKNIIVSFFRGEFFAPDLTRPYPALFHINVQREYRSQGVGDKLVASFLKFLKENQIPGVFISTFSDSAKGFFLKKGFRVVFESRRTYFRQVLRRDIQAYLMVKTL